MSARGGRMRMGAHAPRARGDGGGEEVQAGLCARLASGQLTVQVVQLVHEQLDQPQAGGLRPQLVHLAYCTRHALQQRRALRPRRCEAVTEVRGGRASDVGVCACSRRVAAVLWVAHAAPGDPLELSTGRTRTPTTSPYQQERPVRVDSRTLHEASSRSHNLHSTPSP